MNANIVHRWLREHSQSALAAQSSAFVPVTLSDALPVPASLPDIRIEVQRANTSVIVKWPLQDSKACAAWLREWLA
jgi:transposase